MPSLIYAARPHYFLLFAPSVVRLNCDRQLVIFNQLSLIRLCTKLSLGKVPTIRRHLNERSVPCEYLRADKLKNWFYGIFGFFCYPKTKSSSFLDSSFFSAFNCHRFTRSCHYLPKNKLSRSDSITCLCQSFSPWNFFQSMPSVSSHQNSNYLSNNDTFRTNRQKLRESQFYGLDWPIPKKLLLHLEPL